MAAKASAGQSKVRPRVTGLRLPSELVKELKHIAVDTERTLREVIIAAGNEYAGKYRSKRADR